MAKYTRKELMHRVGIALGELTLSSWTLADKKRLAYVDQGVRALDEEQALLKSGIEELVEAFEKNLPNLFNNSPEVDAYERQVHTLVEGLKKLTHVDLPRVPEAYPDRVLLKGPAPSKEYVKQLKRVQADLGKVPKTKVRVK